MFATFLQQGSGRAGHTLSANRRVIVSANSDGGTLTRDMITAYYGRADAGTAPI